MWKHYCTVERAWIAVGNGEPCNWCPATEPAPASPTDTPESTDAHKDAS